MSQLKYYNTSTSQWETVVVGAQGATGPTGPTGPAGEDGSGVPPAGTTGQFLVKASNTNYDVEWSGVIDGGTP